MEKLPLRAFLFVGLVAILGSLLYYALPVTRFGIAVVIALAAVGAWMTPGDAEGGPRWARRERQRLEHPAGSEAAGPGVRLGRASYALAVIVVLALAAWWSAITPHAITEAVRSPWGIVPPFAVAALGVAFFALLVLLTNPPTRLAITLCAATLFSALAMAAVVYPLGLGFDPFLHRATMAHIAEFGTITPKPLYYIGEYALALAPHLLLGVPLALIDRLLLPLMAAVMLTGSAVMGLAPLAHRKSAIAVAALLFLPLGAFITTTPQGIAYVLAASAVLLSFAAINRVVPFVLAVAALLTHPFAGIPVVLYVVASAVVARAASPALRTAALVATLIAGVVAIPAVFALQAARSGLSLSFHPGNLFDISRWQELALGGFFANHFSFAYDALYLALDNLLWFTIAAAVVGSLALRHDAQRRANAALPAILAVAMASNFIALSILFDFDFLISYERSDYALRSLMMTHIFLLPLAGAGIASVAHRLREKPLVLRGAFLAALAVIGMGNVYGAYPRHDNYARSAGFNVSKADFDAVDAIDDKAEGEDYIVLSNQATAAAAVEAYGFKKYYHGDIFYYPIPTGGVMYQHFLTMVDEGPTRETMDAAMDVAGVNLGFFAVSDYWWQSEQLIENAKRIADDWFSVGDGSVTVFIFRQ